MKTAILAGGLGSRLAEETEARPKPMVEIGGIPILWHIMRYYACFGHQDFVVALGYKGNYIRRYATDFAALSPGNLRIDYSRRQVDYDTTLGNERGEWSMDGWTLELVDTGLETNTGGRIKRLKQVIGNERFFLTWGDGVSTVDLDALLAFHRSHGKLCTLTAVRPPARFGHLEIAGDQIAEFNEKPQTGEGWINGAFFVCEPGVFDYIDGDATQFEKSPLQNLAADGQLMAFKHYGFWQCMDTIRDKVLLESLWSGGEAPWRIWDSRRPGAKAASDTDTNTAANDVGSPACAS
ncbi:glucose-1-phosphate cytidylyltransferase [Paracraurococcus ruber]|uniref:Glucose-1-phosphate cytidylyltransferase n=1 Tax=Paracraurococcus ruber TaxID=77675 RepID=A0ABS1CZH1_9PROT|nr:glucose-1-phosphate cytidylyltransferase [Paracraurococcus ruber]MBK1659716.1 glucose-1-phosphate cytidylyltransferase [Paracraurococcus ruber]TDG29645.1 glucose-1-phosphate cytidylyltransferase [Paracraurococcus ruber]